MVNLISTKNKFFAPSIIIFLTSIAFVYLRISILNSTDYFIVFVYLVITYIGFFVLHCIHSMVFGRQKEIFLRKWSFLNLCYLFSLTVMGLMFSTVLDNNTLISTSFVVLFTLQFLFYVIHVVLYRQSKAKPYIKNNFVSETHLIENSLLLIPLILVSALMVNSTSSQVNPLYLYVYGGFVIVFLVLEVLLHYKQHKFNVNRISIPIVTLLL